MSQINIISSEQSLDRQIDLHLCFYGKEDCLSGHFWGPGVRDQFIFHYINSGKGILKIGEIIYHLSQGQGFLICPNSIIYYKADEEEPWTYTWIGFQGLHAKSYLQRANLSVSQPVFDSNENRWFETFFEQLMVAYHSGRSSDIQYQSILYRFLAELVESSTDSIPNLRTSNPKEAYVKKAVEYIEINFSQKISILDIAHVVGLDRTYLSSLFKEKLGISLQTYLLHFRINRASELMNNGELTVGDISRSVGYTDPFLFSKMFKKTNGVSPRMFRKMRNDERVEKEKLHFSDFLMKRD